MDALKAVNFEPHEARTPDHHHAFMNEPWKQYKRKGLSEMRPYIPGEDLSKFSINPVDTPELGGMVARNPLDHRDQWYVAKKYFEDNLEPA